MNLNDSPQPLPGNLEQVTNFRWFAVFLAILFLLFRIGFKGPDYPVYQAYLYSIFEDGDLNIINNDSESTIPSMPCRETYRNVEVTSTYNYPDFHNHGSVVLWAPFYLYGKIAAATYKLASATPDPAQAERIMVCVLSFSTAALSLLCCLLLYLITANFFPAHTAFVATILLFWGSPFFFYSLLDNGNANIPALFMSLVLILAAPTSLTSKRPMSALLFGLLFAICVAIKLDLWFQTFLVAGTVVIFLSRRNLESKNLLYAGAGFVIGNIPRLLNDYLKFGDFHSGEANLLNFYNSYHLQQLFSPYQGFFTTSPLLLLCLAVLVPLTVKAVVNRGLHDRRDDSPGTVVQLLLAMTVWLAAKLLIIGFRFAWGGGTFGARQLLTELPLFVLLLALLIRWTWQIKQKWSRLLLTTLLAAAIILNLERAGEYMAHESMGYYVHPPGWSTRLAHLTNLVDIFRPGLTELPLKLSCLPLLALLLWLARKILSERRSIQNLLAPWSATVTSGQSDGSRIARSWIVGFSIYLVVSYTAVTTLNLVNNHKNVNRMAAEGCFDLVRVIPRGWLEFRENDMSMEEMLHYYTETNDQQEIQRILAVRERLYPMTTPELAGQTNRN